MDSGSRAITHYRKISGKTWIEENKAAVCTLTALFFLGVTAGAIAMTLSLVAAGLHGYLLFNPIFAFGLGMVLSVGMLYTARAVDRKLFGALKSGIIAIEDRIIAGTSPAQMDDLQKLVDGYLKLKRIEAADYYSKKLLELSKSGGTAVLNLSDWVVTSEFWVSSRAYHKSWQYNLVWLFESRGVLTMSASKLDFQSKKFHFTCNPSHLVSVQRKRHPLWMKPIPCYYIELVIDECGEKHTFCITPSFSHTDTVFDVNNMIDTWYTRLTNFKNSMRPASRCPDWVKDLQA